jgi:hypothetical protein
MPEYQAAWTGYVKCMIEGTGVSRTIGTHLTMDSFNKRFEHKWTISKEPPAPPDDPLRVADQYEEYPVKWTCTVSGGKQETDHVKDGFTNTTVFSGSVFHDSTLIFQKAPGEVVMGGDPYRITARPKLMPFEMGEEWRTHNSRYGDRAVQILPIYEEPLEKVISVEMTHPEPMPKKVYLYLAKQEPTREDMQSREHPSDKWTRSWEWQFQRIVQIE